MHFQHSGEIWRDFPGLVAGALFADGITADVSVAAHTAKFTAAAASRLAAVPESDLPEIQAWRCAAESLLRRFRKQGALPHQHPLVDLCNAVSLAFAIPVAVFDVATITGWLEVRRAAGDEEYLTFHGEVEHPAAGEVIFCDGARRAHARRWTNRQSGRSAVRDSTTGALIVAEAMHESAPADVPHLTAAIADGLKASWSATPTVTVLSQAAPRFTFGP